MSMLDHRWDFDVPAGDSVTFHANTHASATEDNEWFRFEYSTDGVYIRLVDTDQTTLNYLHHVSIDFMSINSFVPLPPEPCAPVTGLVFGGSTTMSWTTDFQTTHYDIMRGSIADLHVHASVGDASCAEPAHASASWSDAEVPPSGQGFYYIVRGRAAGHAPGTFDNPGPPPLGWEQRDAEVGSSGGVACPEP